MRLGTIALAIIAALVAPAYGEAVDRKSPSQHAVTPDEIARRLQLQVERTKLKAPRALRVAEVDFAWPQSAEEYRALAKYIVVLMVAVSQNQQELPLKRVYVEAGGATIELQRISSERQTLPADSPIAPVLGRYREDGFYLAPAGAMMRSGSLLIDFAINRTGFHLYELPGRPPSFVETDPNPDPARGAKPSPQALRTMIEREYPGFPLPPGLR